MTYVRVRLASLMHDGNDADVSHLAELVRGHFDPRCHEGPLIRPFGAPSPVALEARLRQDGAKGRRGDGEFQFAHGIPRA